MIDEGQDGPRGAEHTSVEGGSMRTYSLYIQDDRYSVSTLDFATASDEASIRAIALDRLESSPNHLAIEVWADEKLVFSLTREEASPS
jgi:hypothetical protein